MTAPLTPCLDKSAWTIAPIVDHADAVRLIERWHYSRSAPNTSTARHGLYVMGETIMAEPQGVAMWIPPTRAAAESVAGDDWQGVLCLTRLVVSPDVPTNGVSFLLGRSMRAIDRDRWPWLLTYADMALGHTGAIYRATNWTEVGQVPAGDTWIDGDGRQRGRKRGGKTLLASEMRAAGFTRREPAPKIKFVHGPVAA